MTRARQHQRVIDSLQQRLLAELKDQVHSLVLFGSVARGEASADSDVDVLIITDAPFAVRQRIDEISYDIDLENGVFTQLVFFTAQSFENEAVGLRSYFSSDIIGQGIVLYDDGTLRRIREKASSTVPGIPRR